MHNDVLKWHMLGRAHPLVAVAGAERDDSVAGGRGQLRAEGGEVVQLAEHGADDRPHVRA